MLPSFPSRSDATSYGTDTDSMLGATNTSVNSETAPTSTRSNAEETEQSVATTADRASATATDVSVDDTTADTNATALVPYRPSAEVTETPGKPQVFSKSVGVTTRFKDGKWTVTTNNNGQNDEQEFETENEASEFASEFAKSAGLNDELSFFPRMFPRVATPYPRRLLSMGPTTFTSPLDALSMMLAPPIWVVPDFLDQGFGHSIFDSGASPFAGRGMLTADDIVSILAPWVPRAAGRLPPAETAAETDDKSTGATESTAYAPPTPNIVARAAENAAGHFGNQDTRVMEVA